MHIASRHAARLLLGATALIAGLALIPSAASAFPGHLPPQSHGATALTLDAATATTLTAPAPAGLGLTLGLVAPATEANGAIDFPIINPIANALFTGTIDHSGGITLSGGGETVSLTNFDINVLAKTLSANVSASGPILNASVAETPILSLSFSGTQVRLFPTLTIGPVTAYLTGGAETLLDEAFGIHALAGATIELGTATVFYNVFGWGGPFERL
jgi:hypothetical protein